MNIGVVGRYRLNADSAWRAFPRVAFRGVSRAPSEGDDPAIGAIGYITVIIAPWAMRIYSEIAGAQLADRIVDATCSDPAWRTLWQALKTEMDPLTRLRVVSQWLTTRAATATWSPRTAAIVDAVALDQSVASIARTVSLSTRRVHQLCVQETGHSPTTYRQIARFARLAQALHRDGNAQRWSQHVREYADDSHAIREFRRLARVTPRDYAARVASFLCISSATQRQRTYTPDWRKPAPTESDEERDPVQATLPNRI